MAVPEEVRTEIAAGSDDDFPKFPPFMLYLLQRLDNMEANIRQEIKAETNSLRQEIKAETNSLHQELHTIVRWCIGVFLALIAGFAAVLVPFFAK